MISPYFRCTVCGERMQFSGTHRTVETYECPNRCVHYAADFSPGLVLESPDEIKIEGGTVWPSKTQKWDPETQRWVDQ